MASPPHTWARTGRQAVRQSDSTSVILHLWSTTLPDQVGNQYMNHLPFATSNLFNGKIRNPKFSEKSSALPDLLDSIITYQSTWYDYQQLLQVLFMNEEQDRVLAATQKLVPKSNGQPATVQADIDGIFPLICPKWDHNNPKGRERLKVYHQVIMEDLHVATRWTSNLSKVVQVVQGKGETQSFPRTGGILYL